MAQIKGKHVPFLVILMFGLFAQLASAQHVKTIYGKLVSSLGGNVQTAFVTNEQSNERVPVNKEGVFVLKGKAGDTLRINSGSFHLKYWLIPQEKDPMLFPEIVLTPTERIWKKETAPTVNQSKEPVLLMGRVINDQMKPMKSVNIRIKGKLKGSVSNEKGSFKISCMPGDTLQFLNVGYKMRQFEVTEDAGSVYREVIMVLDTTMLDEITVMPWLTKEMMNYENVPLDASEINRMYLREKALYTDKTQFRKVSFNVAPLLEKWIGQGLEKVKQSKHDKVNDRIEMMRRQMFEDMQMEALRQDSLKRNEVQ